MRAALSIEEGQPLEIKDVTLRAPREGEIRVGLDATAMCVTDVKGFREGMSGARRPYISGHSATGIVTEVGPDNARVKVGDRVVLAGTVECGRCYSCVRGTPSQCDELLAAIRTPFVVGTLEDGTDVIAEAGAGAYATEMIHREACVAVVDSTLPIEQLALLGCGGLSGVGAVLEVGGVVPGDVVLVVGCGQLGLWMIQAARLAGAGRIIALEVDASRLELATALGATDAIVAGDDPVQQILDATGGRGADVALEATASALAIQNLFAMTRRGGVLVPTSMDSRSATVTWPQIPLALHGRQIRSSQSGGGFLHRDVPRIARLIESGALVAEPFISGVYSLDDINRAADDVYARRVINAIIRNQ